MPKFSTEMVKVALMGRYAIREYPLDALGGVMVGVKTLNDAEMDEVRLAAVEQCKRRNVEFVLDPEFLDRTIHRHIIAKSFIDVEDKMGPFFSGPDEVAKLDALLVRTLYELYQTHIQSKDPLTFCPEEEVELLVEQLGKSQMAAARLSLFDRRTLLSFTLSMAKLLAK